MRTSTRESDTHYQATVPDTLDLADHARRTGIARMGWFPGWLRPTDHHRDAGLFLASETCGMADMLVLAVKLTDAGPRRRSA